MRRALKVVLYAIVTETALTGGAALSFLFVGWFALLLYGIVHPALFLFYLSERATVDSMWDSLFRHFGALTSLNVLFLSFLWHFRFRKNALKSIDPEAAAKAGVK